MKVAVLLTTFNRKQKTMACLASLLAQELPDGIHLEIFLTDDASSDGTAQAVEERFPEVHLFSGTGTLFWAGGMRNTWRKAIGHNPDFYLLINDDTLLSPTAVASLLNNENKVDLSRAHAWISIGSTRDENSGKISYGGWKLLSRFRWKSERIHSGQDFADCDFGNANIMLVPKAIVEKIGILADHFTHSLADYDYTLRAKKAGFGVRVAPGFLGSCVDDHGNNWKPQKSTLTERVNYLKSPKGLAYHEYLRFIKDHFPLSYPSAFCKLWVKTFFPFIWENFKR